MNKVSKIVKDRNFKERQKPVINFMGGISYKLNPLETLKMISASSIFGEPQYYRNSGLEDVHYNLDKYVKPYSIFDLSLLGSPSDIMIDAIYDALSYNFLGTLEWALELRKSFYMRLNPQLIMVLASTHPKRKEFSERYPKLFRAMNTEVMKRADEPAIQFALYLYLNGSKSAIPSILKRSWCDRIQEMKRYEMAKYKNSEIGLINTIRVCHAKSPLVTELVTTGNIQVNESQKTWENLRSEGKSFKEILNTINMPHMALLRNLRNIFTEVSDKETAVDILKNLENGVLFGKQFPFRYYSAYNAIEQVNDIHFKGLILDSLEYCMDISLANLPKLKGKTMCLTDNSGSAWGTLNSEYGTVKVADINNLSSVITAVNSDEGYVGKFGDRLEITPSSKRNGILSQAKAISKDRDSKIGGGTENGIWLFFEEAIKKKIHYDNIFIYSDMQAGHGGLYGKGTSYVIGGIDFSTSGSNYNKYIDVMKLIAEYRRVVNSKANIFCTQTAGYDNVLIPEYTYRGAVLYGWTGKESLFASEIINQWDSIERNRQ